MNTGLDLEQVEECLETCNKQNEAYRSLLQIMLDPENDPPQFSKETAWNKFLEIEQGV